MDRYKIYITRKIPENGLQLLLERGYAVDIHDQELPPSPERLKQKIKNVDGIICLLSDKIDKDIINRAEKLKVIANFAVGFNNIDVDYARSKNIMVTNTPDVLTEATADLTWALLLGISKRIVESDQFTRQGNFKGWNPLLLLGGDVTGKTLGLIGAGRIGQAVGYRAMGFRMSVLYYSPERQQKFENETEARQVPLLDLLKQSDYISIHCPLNDQTRHLINRDNIYSIKKGAYLINTARGPIIEEAALVDALRKNHLAGAGLDVYEFEPQITVELFGFSNVILLPHIGSATNSTRSAMARIVAQNVIHVLETGQPLNPVG